MTLEQIKMAKALGRCTFAPGTFQKKFAMSIAATANNNPEKELTEKQDKYLRDLIYRYRRQLPLDVVITQEQHSWNTLQWMAPELARLGVLKNEEWVAKNSADAVLLFKNRGMHTCAALLAALHPFALDYIRTAPVIVLAVSQGSRLHSASERKRVAGLWSPRFASGGKLKKIMEQIELALPLRKLVADALAPDRWSAVQELNRLHYSMSYRACSMLDRVIPPAGEQDMWLRNLHTWTELMRRRFMRANLLLEWAAWNLRPSAIPGSDDTNWTVSEIADFAGAHTDRFNPEWTFATALAETRDWHIQLARATEEEAFALRYGKRWDEDVDYEPLPARLDIAGHCFIGLRSGKTLFEEGLIMHHCVASYARDVIVGRSRIYSIIDAKTGRRCATVEFMRHSDKHGWIPVQCKAFANAPPTKAVGNAVNAFLAHVNQDDEREAA